MSLIDGNTGKFFLLMHDSKVFSEALRSTLLWRDVEETGERVTSCEVLEQTLSFLVWRGSVDRPSSNICCPQCIYLVGLEMSTVLIEVGKRYRQTIKERSGEITIVTRGGQIPNQQYRTEHILP